MMMIMTMTTMMMMALVVVVVMMIMMTMAVVVLMVIVVVVVMIMMVMIIILIIIDGGGDDCSGGGDGDSNDDDNDDGHHYDVGDGNTSQSDAYVTYLPGNQRPPAINYPPGGNTQHIHFWIATERQLLLLGSLSNMLHHTGIGSTWEKTGSGTWSQRNNEMSPPSPN